MKGELVGWVKRGEIWHAVMRGYVQKGSDSVLALACDKRVAISATGPAGYIGPGNYLATMPPGDARRCQRIGCWGR